MTSLVTPNDVRALVKTSLSDAVLQDVIERVEAEITRRIGAPQTDEMATTVTKTMRGEGWYLYMPTEIHAVVSIVEDETTLDSDQYQTWAGGVIERLPCDSNWGDRTVVTYKPSDDRKLRTAAIIDLVRLAIERTAVKYESIAGEYMFTAPENWEVEVRRVMRRLTFQAL